MSERLEILEICRGAIEYDATIDIKHIPTIEKKLGVNINVRGDHIYISKKKVKEVITILFLNGHYSLDPEFLPARIKSIE